MKKYQQAWQMPALQCIISGLEKSWNLHWYDRHKTFFFLCFRRETFV